MKEALPSYVGTEIETIEPSQQKNYATVSLCCLSVTNPFRNKVIQIVAINPWFDRFILVVIIVNCFFLAMDNEVEFITKHSDLIDLVFLIIYTAEMVLKIIAMGFFMRAHSYLRDTWNVVSTPFNCSDPTYLSVGLPSRYSGLALRPDRPRKHHSHPYNPYPAAPAYDQLHAGHEQSGLDNSQLDAAYGRHHDLVWLHADHVRHNCHSAPGRQAHEPLLRN